MAECLNAAAKEGLPLLFLVIDNGRAINTFTGDVAANSDVYRQGAHYGVPGIMVGGRRRGSLNPRFLDYKSNFWIHFFVGAGHQGGRPPARLSFWSP